jgi:hypothetical protein
MNEQGSHWSDARAAAATFECMLVWLAGEVRLERALVWYRARRPCAFIVARPPSVN